LGGAGAGGFLAGAAPVSMIFGSGRGGSGMISSSSSSSSSASSSSSWATAVFLRETPKKQQPLPVVASFDVSLFRRFVTHFVVKNFF
jgi:hypothetical protein